MKNYHTLQTHTSDLGISHQDFLRIIQESGLHSQVSRVIRDEITYKLSGTHDQFETYTRLLAPILMGGEEDVWGDLQEA